MLKPKSLIDEVEEYVDRSIPVGDLSSISLNVGILHLLRCYEDYCRISLPQLILSSGSAGDLGSYQAGLKLAQDSMQFAMHWLHTNCLPSVKQVHYNTDPSIYRLTGILRYQAEQYSSVWDYLTLVRKDWAEMRLEATGELVLKTCKLPNPAAEVVDNILFAPDPPGTESIVDDYAEQFGTEVLSQFSVHPTGRSKISYKLPVRLMERMIAAKEELISHLWTLDSNWNLGTYSIKDFQRFWSTLLTKVTIHYHLCTFQSQKLGVGGGAIDSLIMVHTKSEWVKDLSVISGLAADTVSAILDDLTYNPDLYFQPKKKDPDVTCQPFFHLSSDLLGLSNQLVMMSNADRNIWELVSILRPKVHAKTRNEKEERWLRDLEPFFKEKGLFSKGHISLGEFGDIDLLVIDQVEKFGIVFQLKWLAAPDRINQVGHAAKELQRGIDQAKKALDWIRSNSAALSSKTGIGVTEISEIEFEGIVLSMNTTAGGRVYDEEVPIISERLVKWVIDEPWNRNLRDLFSVAKEGNFYPIVGKHYDESDTTASFAGLRFRGENFGMTWKDSWDPKTGIQFG